MHIENTIDTLVLENDDPKMFYRHSPVLDDRGRESGFDIDFYVYNVGGGIRVNYDKCGEQYEQIYRNFLEGMESIKDRKFQPNQVISLIKKRFPAHAAFFELYGEHTRYMKYSLITFSVAMLAPLLLYQNPLALIPPALAGGLYFERHKRFNKAMKVFYGENSSGHIGN